jgi:ATP-dependent RNA circularization protein (DNA/RNA ligase family)
MKNGIEVGESYNCLWGTMSMQRYPELMRVKSNRIELRGDKKYADKGALKDFLKGKKHLVIEEKIDGSNMAVGWKGGQPYVQGRNSHIALFGDKRPQYRGAVDWAWENVAKLELLKGYLVFGEWVRVQHYIHYDLLPDWFIAYDVWDLKAKRFLDYKKKLDFLTELGFFLPQVLYSGKVTVEKIEELTIEQASYFSTTENMEGCVIKDYRSQEFVKFVCREFIEGIDEMGHWTSSERQRLNRLCEG